MKNKQRLIPAKAVLLFFLVPLMIALMPLITCSAQTLDASLTPAKKKAYTLKINKGDYWIGGGLGLTGSVAPMGQYIGTAAQLSAKGGYHFFDKFSVGVSLTAGISISDKKSKGIYTRGISMLVGPIVQYMIPVSKTVFLAPIVGATWGPISVKSMVSQPGAPEEYVKIKGHAFCELAGIGPFFEVIPEKASFGAQILVSSLQQTTTVHGNNGDGIPGSKVKDNKSGPALNIEFRLHF
ncbi:hypothetical protein [Chitinophaga filiformis]|uniref:Outer membrane protein beta-barrel domain-containing protein n=1 Tax=Chitinophaga filiformis TaxID=104663 RepID=A0ABY4I7Z4_CHIFI|nr:hypothetical protein [Chitinophaga filiformis]UPK72216.1 hypothetical protein MYF79_13060 [Chitinophaga filiformis]